MIDPNFLTYAINAKKRQMATASLSELARLNADCNEMLHLLAEGEPQDREFIERNQKWLSKPLGRAA